MMTMMTVMSSRIMNVISMMSMMSMISMIRRRRRTTKIIAMRMTMDTLMTSLNTINVAEDNACKIHSSLDILPDFHNLMQSVCLFHVISRQVAILMAWDICPVPPLEVESTLPRCTSWNSCRSWLEICSISSQNSGGLLFACQSKPAQ